jgi:hypothetical protein
MQLPLQTNWVGEQAFWHLPKLQTWLPAHAVPHIPQSLGLVWTFTH